MSTEPTREQVEEFFDGLDLVGGEQGTELRADAYRNLVAKFLTPTETPEPPYRLWVNLERTVLVRLWVTGVMEVCTRDESGAIWCPPTELTEEKVR